MRSSDVRLGKGYLTPAMRNWALDLCRADEAAFDDFMKTALPAYAHIGKQLLPSGPPDATFSALTDPDALAICA